MSDPGAFLRSYDPRPRSTTELLDAAFAVLRSDPKAIAVFGVLPSAVASAILGLIPRTLNPWVNLPRTALSFCLLAVFSYALQSLWAQRLLGHHPSLRSAAGAAVRSAPAVMLSTLLSALLVTVGWALLVVPGIYATMALLLPAPVLVFERVGALRSLARSRTLMQGSKRRIALPFAALVILSLTVSFAPLGGSYGRWPRVVLSSLLLGAFSALAFVSYLDVRARKEGFDLEILAARVAARTGATEEAVAAGREALGSGGVP